MSEHEPPRNPEVRYERVDVDAGALLKYGFWLVLAALAVILLLWRLYFVFVDQEARRQPPPPVMRPDAAALLPPPPVLQEAPALDLQTLRAREDAVLGSYGWVDREAGVLRIPIDEAMRVVAERGLPETIPPAAQHGDVP
jgi:hypothetical protein